MSLNFILILTSCLIFIAYNAIAIKLFDIPASLSNTFYLYNNIKKNLGYVFSIMMVVCTGLLIPAWLEITADSNFQFLSFLTCGALLFVAYAPNFKSNDITNKVHSISAIIAAILGISWTCFTTPFWILPVLYLLLFLGIALMQKNLKKCYIYWLEMVAFASIYTTLLIMTFFLY